MTFDVTLRKNGREFPSPMTIHGMSYGAEVFEWAKEFVSGDCKIPFKEVKIKAKKFHRLFVEYCKSITTEGDSNYFGGDAEGYYYDLKKLDKDKIAKFEVTKRWLDVYITALAFECDIDFQ